MNSQQSVLGRCLTRAMMLSLLFAYEAKARDIDVATQTPAPEIRNRESTANVAYRSAGDHAISAGHISVSLSVGGMPTELLSGNESLLAGKINVSINGVFAREKEAYELWRSADASVSKQTYHGTIYAETPGGNVSLSVSAGIESDGLVSVSLGASGLTKGKLKQVVYEIPIPGSVAKFLHKMGEVGFRNFLLDERSRGFDFSYTPFLWVGNDERGIFWASETSSGWANASDPHAIQLRRSGKDYSLRICVDVPPETEGKWAHSFSLLPTPVKSLPVGWRRQRIWPAHGANIYVIWPDERDAGMRWFGYPESDQPTRLRNYIGNIANAGMKAAPYATPTWAFTGIPEWLTYAPEWSAGVSDADFEKNSSASSRFVNVCSSAESWRRVIEDKFASFIHRFSLRAIYLDNSQAYQSSGCISGRNERKNLVEFELLPQREIYQHIVNDLRSEGPGSIAIAHSSGGLNVMSFDAVDGLVSGEQFRGKVRRDYLEVASLLDFRVELNGRQWGLIPYFLPEFTADVAKEIAPTRKLMTILLLHDAIPWPKWANVEEINRGLESLDKFGVEDAEFYPYYSKEAIARTSAADIYVSGYLKAHQILLVVGNLSDSSRDATICKTVRAGKAWTKIETWPASEILHESSGCFHVDVPADSYKLFRAIVD